MGKTCLKCGTKLLGTQRKDCGHCQIIRRQEIARKHNLKKYYQDQELKLITGNIELLVKRLDDLEKKRQKEIEKTRALFTASSLSSGNILKNDYRFIDKKYSIEKRMDI